MRSDVWAQLQDCVFKPQSELHVCSWDSNPGLLDTKEQARNHLMPSACHPYLSHFTGNIWLTKENRFLYSKLFRFHIDSFVQSIVSEFVVNTLGIKGRQRWRPLQYKHSGDHHYPTTESQKPNLAAQPHFLGTSDLHYNELKCLQAWNHFPEILGKRLNLFFKLLSPKLRICFQLWDGFLRSRTE